MTFVTLSPQPWEGRACELSPLCPQGRIVVAHSMHSIHALGVCVRQTAGQGGVVRAAPSGGGAVPTGVEAGPAWSGGSPNLGAGDQGAGLSGGGGAEW